MLHENLQYNNEAKYYALFSSSVYCNTWPRSKTAGQPADNCHT